MIDVLFTMLLELLNHERMTAAELADRLEVSERTVYRYADALSLAGVPVTCRKGRGGGIAVGEEFRLSAQYLTENEMQLVVSALDTLPLSEASGKIKAKLFSLRRGGAGAFRNAHFVVDKTAFGNQERLAGKLEALVRAMESRTAVRIRYSDRAGQVSERVVEPYTVVYGDGVWYIYAWCRLRAQKRLFKVSRITHIHSEQERFAPRDMRPDWDLSLPRSADNAPVDFVIQTDEHARYDVEEWLGVESVTPDGVFWAARGTVTGLKNAADKILSFGGHVRVLSPPALAEAVRNTCREILTNYERASGKNSSDR